MPRVTNNDRPTEQRPSFKKWLLATRQNFPAFEPLLQFISTDSDWPTGHDKAALRKHLRQRRRGDLAASLAQALDAFDVLCMPSMPIPMEQQLPWEWHSPAVLRNTKASLKRHSRHRRVPTHVYRRELGERLAAEMARKIKIYVDTCHWVKMRDFELERNVPGEYGEILQELRRLVATGRFVCAARS